MKTGTVKTLSLGLTLACAAPAQAQVTGEVIAAQLAYSTNTAVMSATNGGQYSEVPCGTDLSHGGSPRYFLDAVPSGQFLPEAFRVRRDHRAFIHSGKQRQPVGK